MLAFDALEQLDADPLQLVAANARRDRRPRGIEIGFEKAVGKGAHAEPRHLAVLEHDRALSHQRNRGMKLMRSAAQRLELRARTCAVTGFGKPPRAKRQDLVGPQYQP